MQPLLIISGNKINDISSLQYLAADEPWEQFITQLTVACGSVVAIPVQKLINTIIIILVYINNVGCMHIQVRTHPPCSLIS